MRHFIASALVLVVSLPGLASAQLGDALGPPAAPVPGAPADVPPPPSHTPSGYGAPATAQWQLDPELQTLRSTEPRDTVNSEGPGFGKSFGFAWAGFGMGAGAGALLGGAIAGGICSGDGGGMCPLVAILGAGMGSLTLAPFGAGLATWAFGDSSGGTGNAFAAIGGAYLGAGLGAGLVAGLAQLEPTWGSALGVALGVVLTNLGAAAGYELSSSGRRPAPEARANFLVLPTAGVTSDGQGGEVGLVGTF